LIAISEWTVYYDIRDASLVIAGHTALLLVVCIFAVFTAPVIITIEKYIGSHRSPELRTAIARSVVSCIIAWFLLVLSISNEFDGFQTRDDLNQGRFEETEGTIRDAVVYYGKSSHVTFKLGNRQFNLHPVPACEFNGRLAKIAFEPRQWPSLPIPWHEQFNDILQLKLKWPCV
jgi:hypothetical protein